MLNNACPRSFTVGIVHRSISLEVWLIQSFRFKANRTVFQRTQLIIKVGINRAGVDDLVSQCIQFRFVLQIVCVQTNLNAIQQIGNHLGIAANRNTLKKRIEIVVIKSQTNRKTSDNKGWQLFAVTSPLLLSVAFDKFLVDIATDERNGLLFEILRFSSNLFALLFNFSNSFLRSHNAPHLIKCIHIKGQRIQLTLVVGHRRVRKAVELRKLGDVVPDFFVVSMENMSAILVDIDALNILGIDVARNVRALVNYQNRFPMSLSFMCKNSSIKSRSYY